MEQQNPTLCFSNPPLTPDGTAALCERCLRLLALVVKLVGDGSGHSRQELPHYAPVSGCSATCVICVKIRMGFDAERAHLSEERLRRSAITDWKSFWNVKDSNRVWRLEAEKAHAPGCVSVSVNVLHKTGYGIDIGGFDLHRDTNDSRSNDASEAQEKRPGDYAIILPIDQTPGTHGAAIDGNFWSTVGTGPLKLIDLWAMECFEQHANCNRIFANESILSQAKPWYPDRLIRLITDSNETTSAFGGNQNLAVRVVEKCDTSDFPVGGRSVPYISLSHCWGLSVRGREKDVLTNDKLSTWKRDIPMQDLPQTFKDAIRTCYLLDLEHIWIDSLCIIQDSAQDWLEQSEVMADVYKHAILNIAALSSLSDQDGFINDNRDLRVHFGFRVDLAAHLRGRDHQGCSEPQNDILLQGQPVLTWHKSRHLLSINLRDAPLYHRGWVFQERNLARRTLGFTQQGIVWACDGFQRIEEPGEAGIFEPEYLRKTQQQMYDLITKIVELQTGGAGPPQIRASQQTTIQTLRSEFDYRWRQAIDSYTQCKLTKQTDKLIAISAIAREYASIGSWLTGGTRYLAGLWEFNLLFQLPWRSVDGDRNPRRKYIGDGEYVAPSWSWASIEGRAAPDHLFPKPGVVALADVVAADVVKKTKFEFGFVNGGWIRLRAKLNGVGGIGRKAPQLTWSP